MLTSSQVAVRRALWPGPLDLSHVHTSTWLLYRPLSSIWSESEIFDLIIDLTAMGETVTTIMVLKVDLQCHRCYKKVKKILCKFPQIRDQVYDEKQNTVLIKVVCCSPEKIKEKIRCKGGDSIKSIEIVPPPPPPKPKPVEKPPPPEKPKPVEKPPEPAPKPPPPAEKPKPVEKPPEPAPKPPPPAEKPKPVEKPPAPAPKPPPPAEPPCIPVAYPPPFLPIDVCCRQCYHGVGGGPCFHGHGGPPPSYEGYGRPVYDSYGGGGYRSCYESRCDYFSEDNPSGCTVM
ncbi:protein PYRICULARIA ORYZAE RESISTANCE 21 [Corylus avellana]|uniref:protein PYRICULARIA ORYZAE RESISTANCE 21 n=1 Tax=Corylus avellana TaxID=13451 RepID=UPI00286B0CC9|nr:protein PYRICULARIA ORYZAE RESISTANCE 21 [Corylus avellana]